MTMIMAENMHCLKDKWICYNQQQYKGDILGVPFQFFHLEMDVKVAKKYWFYIITFYYLHLFKY